MEKKVLMLVVLFAAAGLYCSTALANAPIGPPTAGLKFEQTSAGFGYTYGKIDSFNLHWSSDYASGIPNTKAKDMRSNSYLGRFGYGLRDNWELYGFLGAADMKGKMESENFDSKYDFNGGFGTKYTILKDGQLSWGIVYQMLFGRGRDRYREDLTDYGYGIQKVKAKLDWFDIFLATGPTYEMKNWRIYGGAGLYYFNADIDISVLDTKVLKGDADKSLFGGYAGAEVDLDEKSSLYGEYMFTSDAWAIGTGIVFKF